MDNIVYLLLCTGTVSVLFVNTGADMDIKLKPEAEKLTIDIDSMADRIPPQIAYFIPDRFLNPANFGLNTGNQPPLINMWPPNNQTSVRNQTVQMNVSDLMMSSQRPIRFIAAPDDTTTVDQNFDYNIDFTKLPDKKPDFKRFEKLYRESAKSRSGKSKKKKHTKRPVSSDLPYNYANPMPNIRHHIKVIKMNHKNEFVDSNENEKSESVDDNDSNSTNESDRNRDRDRDESDSESMEQYQMHKSHGKTHKNKKQHKKPRYLVTKLSQPTSSVENESNQRYYDDTNTNELNENEHENAVYHTNHKNCDHRQHSNFVDHPQRQQRPYNDHVYNSIVRHKPRPSHKHRATIKIPRKGYSIYLTKVMKQPRIDSQGNEAIKFVPTRMLSSVRGTEEVVRKPRKFQQPRLRAKVSESGGHMVYTEDGYEDANYDHGSENLDHEYLKRSKRSAKNANELRGQELIDHLDNLIRNVSDYLNSSEIIPNISNKKYPLYNTSDANIQDSPIRYSEYAKPIVDEDHSSELYDSKVRNCDEDTIGTIDLSNVGNETESSGPRKRLGSLGYKLECLKEKLFGTDPLDNPLFEEEEITEPDAKNIVGSVASAADNIQAISSVYSDVMDNIKLNSHNENQRIFSDYGVTDSFVVGAVLSTDQSLESDLNTNEEMPQRPIRKRVRSTSIRPSVEVTESPLIGFNPFNNPAQVPILDISKFIPTPNYQSDDSFIDTDFRPIVSPYAASNDFYHIQTTEPTTSGPTTTPRTTATTTTTTQRYVLDRQTQPTRRFHYQTLSNQVNTNYGNQNSRQTLNLNPNQTPNQSSNQYYPHYEIVNVNPNSYTRSNPNANFKQNASPSYTSFHVTNPYPNTYSSPGQYQNVNQNLKTNINRNQIQNLMILRRRLPVQIVRVVPKNL